VKLFLSNIIDKFRNPLNQSISHNHKQEANLMAKAKLSDTRTIKPPRNQASKRPVIPVRVKEGSKARKEEEEAKE